MDQTQERSPESQADHDRVDSAFEHQPASDREAAVRTSTALVQRQTVEADQEEEGDELEADEMLAAAEEGIAGPGGELPHKDRIQESFGADHDVSSVKAHVGGAAGTAAAEMGAEAFATGNDVGFQEDPDLHTAAHEAAHVVQQNAGVQLKGGVGEVGDAYEQEADRVADLTVAGRSAAGVLAKYTPTRDADHGAAQRTAVQHRKKSKGKGKKPAAPTLLTSSEAHAHIKEGQDGKEGLLSGKNKAAALYNIMVAQAKVKTVHEEVKKAYDDAKKTRDKALAKSDLEKVLTAIFTLVELGTSIYGVIKAAKTIATAAKGLKDSYDMYKATDGKFGAGIAKDILKEGGKTVVEGGKSVKDGVEKGKELLPSSQVIDPDTILADTNHAAIVAGNTALSNLVEAQIEYGFVDVEADIRAGALDFAQMMRGVELATREKKALPAESLAEVTQLIASCEALQKEIKALTSKLQATWKAYMAGGAEALADPRERGLFEKVQAWQHAGDSKAKSLAVAMDQSTKHVWFKGSGIDTASGMGMLAGITYHTHRYSENVGQIEQGTLYVSDPAAAAELKPLLAPDLTEGLDMMVGKGAAESRQDEAHAGAQKFFLTMGMCKALSSLGVETWFVDATVHMYNEGTWITAITNRHNGEWFEKWYLTPEFDAFWSTTLGRRWAFIQEGRGDKKKIPSATKEEVDKSTHVPDMGRMPM